MAALTREVTELRALQADQQRTFAEGLRVATAPIEPLRAAARLLLADLVSTEDGSCTVCGEAEGHTVDCSVPALAALVGAS